MTATATRRPSSAPIPNDAFRTWTPAPDPMTERERAMLLLAREAYDRNPEASTVALSSESLRAMWQQIDRLEAERDRLGDQGIEFRTRARRAEAQLKTQLERFGPIAAWAAKRLRCDVSLAKIVAAIARAGK